GSAASSSDIGTAPANDMTSGLWSSRPAIACSIFRTSKGGAASTIIPQAAASPASAVTLTSKRRPISSRRACLGSQATISAGRRPPLARSRSIKAPPSAPAPIIPTRTPRSAMEYLLRQECRDYDVRHIDHITYPQIHGDAAYHVRLLASPSTVLK